MQPFTGRGNRLGIARNMAGWGSRMGAAALAGLPAAVGFGRSLLNRRFKRRGRRAVSTAVDAKTNVISHGLVRQEGSSTSASSYNFGRRPQYSKKLTGMTGPQHYVRNEAGTNVQSAVGLQTMYDYRYLSYTELNAIKGIVPDAPTTTSRFLIESVKAEHIMANASSYTIRARIYDVMCRRDTPVSGYDVTDTIINGLNNEGGTSTSYQTIGVDPLQSEQFNQFYKVCNVTAVDIPSGGCHRHSIKFTPNKIIHAEVVNSLSGNTAGSLADFGIFTLVMFHGQPAHDSTTTTSVTVSAASLDIITSLDIVARFWSDTSATWFRSNNLASSFAVGPQFVNDLVGQTQDAGGLHPGTLIS